MKRTSQKLLAWLLAGIMLLPMAACGNTDGEGPDTLPPKEGDTLSEGETTDPNYTCDLPADLNFGDTEVNILYAKVAGREDIVRTMVDNNRQSMRYTGLAHRLGRG